MPWGRFEKLADRLLNRSTQRPVGVPELRQANRLTHQRVVGDGVEKQRLPNRHFLVAFGREDDRGLQEIF